MGENVKSLSLPAFPKGRELEEYISALFQCAGHYVERNIIERDIEEVLELDIILTDYDNSVPGIRLVEVKSRGWGFRDLFALRGCMHYLDLSQGLFITSKGRANIDFVEKKARALGVALFVIPDLDDSVTLLSEVLKSKDIDSIDSWVWRYSYWLERNLLQHLKHKKKSELGPKRFKALEDYHFEVNSGIFFAQNTAERIERCYGAYRRFPNISAKCANEMTGKDFHGDCRVIPSEVFGKTYYDCTYNEIQISTFIEHRARLAILKNAIDYVLYENAGLKYKSDGVLEDGERKWLLVHVFPDSFMAGLDTISKHPYFHRYPVFWQWFMWLFGGFVLKDYEEEEYEMLSRKTGIPPEEIPNALSSYQLLFPTDGGWFTPMPSDSNIEIMKMFPVPFMGIGAYYRSIVYTQSSNLMSLKVSGTYTLGDLLKWNNLMVEVLREGR